MQTEEVEQLEKEASRSPSTRPQHKLEVLQLPLFGGANPVVEELASLDVNAMSPIEALTNGGPAVNNAA